jgi:hypothetical protein
MQRFVARKQRKSLHTDGPCNDENGFAHSRAQVHFFGETVETISGKSCVFRHLAHQRPVWCRFQVAVKVQKSPILQRMVARKQRKALHTGSGAMAWVCLATTKTVSLIADPRYIFSGKPLKEFRAKAVSPGS